MDDKGNLIDLSKLTPITDAEFEELKPLNRADRRKHLALSRRKLKSPRRKKRKK